MNVALLGFLPYFLGAPQAHTRYEQVLSSVKFLIRVSDAAYEGDVDDPRVGRPLPRERGLPGAGEVCSGRRGDGGGHM